MMVFDSLIKISCLVVKSDFKVFSIGNNSSDSVSVNDSASIGTI